MARRRAKASKNKKWIKIVGQIIKLLALWEKYESFHFLSFSSSSNSDVQTKFYNNILEIFKEKWETLRILLFPKVLWFRIVAKPLHLQILKFFPLKLLSVFLKQMIQMESLFLLLLSNRHSTRYGKKEGLTKILILGSSSVYLVYFVEKELNRFPRKKT